MDAVNEELLRPTHDPRADTEYNHPWGSKGTEPESLKIGSLQKLTYTSLRYFQQMASRHPGMKPRISAHCANLMEALKTASPSEEHILNNKSFYEGSKDKTADVKEHTAPKILPPRDRRHLDAEVQAEIDADLDPVTAATNSIKLTLEQDALWQDAFVSCSESLSNGNGDLSDEDEAMCVETADNELIEAYPELAKYEHWLDSDYEYKN
jgi:hypothetical protein